ncbi:MULTISPECIES: putative holin-like toxin [Weissella]
MSVHDAISLMILFGSFLLALIDNHKKKGKLKTALNFDE